MSKRKVVITGAAGSVAGRMLPTLRERYDLILLDVRTTNWAGEEVSGIQIADLSNRDRDTYRHFFRGVDTVVHCAFIRNERPEDFDEARRRYWDERANIDMAYNIYQTSLAEGVRRVVVASSNHATDYYEHLIWAGEWDMITPEMRPLSDNFYGWSKAAYEHLGFVFAAGMVGDRPLENIQIRIGAPRESDIERCPTGDLRCVRRALGAYLSPRDQTQLFVKSIEAEDIRDERGIPFQIFYGISNNSLRFWSIANARKIIGYTPRMIVWCGSRTSLQCIFELRGTDQSDLIKRLTSLYRILPWGVLASVES